MIENKFLKKFEDKTDSELEVIIKDKESYIEEARTAAIEILKGRDGFSIVAKNAEIDIEIAKDKSISSQQANKVPDHENETKALKLYSQKAIGIATFLGGTLAATYLIRENYLSLNKPEEGKKTLIIGVIGTICFLSALLIVPEHILDQVPNQVYAIVITGIIYLIVEKLQGETLKKHKDNENEFHSGWKAAGVGFISLIILLSGIVGYAYLSPAAEVYDNYDIEIAKFTANETTANIFYEHIDTDSRESLQEELTNITIPKWKENITLIKNLNNIEDLPSELKAQNIVLIKYSELRIEALELFQKAIRENTDKYSQEIDAIHLDIDKQLEKLN
jgi:hypothetical protein